MFHDEWNLQAGVAELVDAVDSKSIVRKDVLVRFQSSVLKALSSRKPHKNMGFFCDYLAFRNLLNTHKSATIFILFGHIWSQDILEILQLKYIFSILD